MSYTLRLTFNCHSLPGRGKNHRKDPFPPNANSRQHWARRAAQVKAWRHRTFLEVGSNRPPEPLKRARLILVRHSSVKGDPDNIIGSFKAIIDGLKDAGVLADDRDVELVPRHVKAPQGKGMMEIIVEETR